MVKHLIKASVLIIAITGSAYPVVALSETTSKLKQFNVHVRSLAATCATCHGTQGNTVNVPGQSNLSGKPEKLAGIDADFFVEQMLAFRSDERKGTVMNHHAKGLNDEEINALGAYLTNPTKE